MKTNEKKPRHCRRSRRLSAEWDALGRGYSKNRRFANRIAADFCTLRPVPVGEIGPVRHLCSMAILKLARMGHPVLLTRADPVDDPAAPEIARLLADMAETLDDAGGVGLAAPQVHVPLRLFIYKLPERRVTGEADDEPRGLTAVINPELTLHPGAPVEDWEGCLSIPGMTALIPRAARVTLRGVDAAGVPFARQAAGFHARVIQHEYDHLDGRLYLSRMPDLRMVGFNEEIGRYRDDVLAVHHQPDRAQGAVS